MCFGEIIHPVQMQYITKVEHTCNLFEEYSSVIPSSEGCSSSADCISTVLPFAPNKKKYI